MNVLSSIISSSPAGLAAGHQRHRTAMAKNLIEVKDVVLHYPLTPLLRSSIKESMLGMAFGQRPSFAPRFVEALRSLSLTVKSGERVGIIGAQRRGKGRHCYEPSRASIRPPRAMFR